MQEIKNKLICGDNLRALDDLINQGVKVDLIYLDPPFFSKRNYEVIWGDEAEIRSFEDRWEGGMEVYIEWMKERVSKLYEVLSDTGSLYLHCDWHASHYLKVMCDDIFGYGNFRNEIVWHYRRWSAPSRKFQRLHDTILFYTKSNNYSFNEIRVPSANEEKGRKESYKPDADGNMYRTQSLNGKQYTIYKNVDGVLLGDVWHISYLHPSAKERLGYPTQKPEALLARIILASSNKGDIVLDPFDGCGTAMAVSQMLERKWIGIDISPTAVKVVKSRLRMLGSIEGRDYESIGMPTTETELRELKPFEFQNWVIDEIGAKHSRTHSVDFGLDGHFDNNIFHKKAGIQVKQSDKVGRNVVDNFETALERGGFNKGLIIAFSFTKRAYEEAARAKTKKNKLNIELVKVLDILSGKTDIF